MTQGDLLLKTKTEIGVEREEMFDSIQKELEQHPHVMGYFYEVPKHINLNNNIYLNIIVQPAFYSEFVSHKRALSTMWGEVLFQEDYYDTSEMVIHYKNLMKVYLKIFRPQDLKPSHQYKNIEIAYDPYELMSYISELSETSQYKVTFEELDNWRTKFFANYYEFYRSLNSQEAYQAIHCLDVMRWLIAAMWMMRAHVQPNQYLDWSCIEGADSILTEGQREKLKKWQLSSERMDLNKTIQLVVEEFKMLHDELCQQFGVIEDADYVERIISHAKRAS